MLLRDLAAALNARLLGDGDTDILAVRIAADAGPGELGFVQTPRDRRAARTSAASALLVDEEFAAEHADEMPCAVLASANPSLALARALTLLLQPASSTAVRIDPRACVHPDAKLGARVSIGAHAVIGACRLGDDVVVAPLAYVADGAVVGDGCQLGPGAVVLQAARLGARVLVGPGAVVGDEGFVFAPDLARNVRVPHAAGVLIGDDVDIGANACVDRGLLRDTRVGPGTKIDNLAQLAHDVQVGADVVVVAQVGIAGGAAVGDEAVLGGQAGVNPHVVIAPRVRVGGQAGVVSDVSVDGAIVSGMPAMPHHEWLKAMARLKRLDALERRVRALESRLGDIEPEESHE